MVQRAAPAHRAQKARIEALQHQRAINDRQQNQGEGGNAADHVDRRVINGQNGAEQHVQQIDAGTVQRDNQHPGGQ